MGFRNPLTSLSGDQITPGTITGSKIQTAASGKRIVMVATGTPATSGTLQLFTGDTHEAQWGRIEGRADTSQATLRGALDIYSPVVNTGGPQLIPAAITLLSSNGSGTVPASVVIDAETIYLGDVGDATVNAGVVNAKNIPTIYTTAGAKVAKPRIVVYRGGVTADASSVVTFNLGPLLAAVHTAHVAGVATGTWVNGEIVNATPSALGLRMWSSAGLVPGQSFNVAVTVIGEAP